MISELTHYIAGEGTFTKLRLVRDSFGRKGKATDTKALGRGNSSGTPSSSSSSAISATVQGIGGAAGAVAAGIVP